MNSTAIGTTPSARNRISAAIVREQALNGVFSSTAEDERPLMVRARSADDDEAAGELEIDIQADRLLHALSESDLLKETSPHIRQRVLELSEARQASGTRQRTALGGRRTAAELRAFEGMILRAANLVFATTNSAAVERLIEERGLFDWTIVEEAGKATGGELLSPLLLSHRRLMIGDHKQLPPFDIDKVTKLLASTKQVMDVVSLIDDLVSRYLKDPSVDETFQEVETASDDFGKTCADTLAVLSLFETFVEREFARQKKGMKGRYIARRLEEQYRMHPAIARIVSKCFYDGALTTNPKRERMFLTSPPPVVSANSERLPELPVIFIDTPYGREESPGGQTRDRLPPWWNPVEVNAAVRALELLRPAPDVKKAPTLAVLSPYWQQVGKIEKAITRKKDGTLSHLSDFAPAIEKEICGTVDSFQGGEADVVLVSLVRNNSHATPAKALGFLRDNRRINVLLSRAKWRLVLVGSLSFYRNVLEISKNLPDQDIGFLGKFLEALGDAVRDKEGAIVSYAKISGGKP
jgi:superfamily I DNA and/or RNA helicase